MVVGSSLARSLARTPLPVSRQQVTAWAHICDACGQTGPDLALTPSQLADDAEMRQHGWWIADNGDATCAACMTGKPMATDDSGDDMTEGQQVMREADWKLREIGDALHTLADENDRLETEATAHDHTDD
jgi:hypothetical protein